MDFGKTFFSNAFFVLYVVYFLSFSNTFYARFLAVALSRSGLRGALNSQLLN